MKTKKEEKEKNIPTYTLIPLISLYPKLIFIYIENKNMRKNKNKNLNPCNVHILIFSKSLCPNVFKITVSCICTSVCVCASQMLPIQLNQKMYGLILSCREFPRKLSLRSPVFCKLGPEMRDITEAKGGIKHSCLFQRDREFKTISLGFKTLYCDSHHLCLLIRVLLYQILLQDQSKLVPC